MLPGKTAAKIGLVAIIGWTVIEYFGFSFKNAMLVLSGVGLAWIVLLWRDVRSRHNPN